MIAACMASQPITPEYYIAAGVPTGFSPSSIFPPSSSPSAPFLLLHPVVPCSSCSHSCSPSPITSSIGTRNRMVFYLLSLAGDERVKAILRMQNNEAEAELHQAVHLEDKGVVGVLLSADSQSQLARVMGRIVSKQQTQSKPNEGFHLNRPELLIAAAHGDSDEIKRLLPLHGEEDAAHQPAEVVLEVEDAVTDVEKPAATAVSPSEAVTGAGDSVLHVVASSGDADEFLETATVIVGKANHLLDGCNRKGDTPLHCAARFRNARMVYHLVALARAGDGTSDERDGVGDERVKAILRMQNLKGETVLHEAVRLEDKKMIGELG